MKETTAQEIMTTDLICAREDMTIEETLKILMNHRITGLPVVDSDGKIKGVVSEFDLLQQLAESELQKKNTKATYLAKIQFSSQVLAIEEDAPLSKVVKTFIEKKVRRLPVLDAKGKLLGIITRRDLIRIFYYRAILDEVKA